MASTQLHQASWVGSSHHDTFSKHNPFIRLPYGWYLKTHPSLQTFPLMSPPEGPHPGHLSPASSSAWNWQLRCVPVPLICALSVPVGSWTCGSCSISIDRSKVGAQCENAQSPEGFPSPPPLVHLFGVSRSTQMCYFPWLITAE